MQHYPFTQHNILPVRSVANLRQTWQSTTVNNVCVSYLSIQWYPFRLHIQHVSHFAFIWLVINFGVDVWRHATHFFLFQFLQHTQYTQWSVLYCMYISHLKYIIRLFFFVCHMLMIKLVRNVVRMLAYLLLYVDSMFFINVYVCLHKECAQYCSMMPSTKLWFSVFFFYYFSKINRQG